MTFILLLFYLIAPPQDRPICVLWLNRPATSADVAAACGTTDLDQDRVDFISLNNGKIYCSSEAVAIYNPPSKCDLPGTLDQYHMLIIQPGTTERLLCAIQSSNNPPTRAEVSAACSPVDLHAFDIGAASLRLMGPVQPDQQQTTANSCQLDAPLLGPGLYDQVGSLQELATHQSLTWLAGRLIWFGIVRPWCDGYSGLDPISFHANGCGSIAAQRSSELWQNQFDQAIYAAALVEGVPGRLIKRVISIESQFWPLWNDGPRGEIGLAQVTAAGADQYLRIYNGNYAYASPVEQNDMQAAFLALLRCDYCSLYGALQKERANIIYYARLLRAYRCSSADWRAALVRWNGELYAEKIEKGQ